MYQNVCLNILSLNVWWKSSLHTWIVNYHIKITKNRNKIRKFFVYCRNIWHVIILKQTICNWLVNMQHFRHNYVWKYSKIDWQIHKMDCMLYGKVLKLFLLIVYRYKVFDNQMKISNFFEIFIVLKESISALMRLSQPTCFKHI